MAINRPKFYVTPQQLGQEGITHDALRQFAAILQSLAPTVQVVASIDPQAVALNPQPNPISPDVWDDAVKQFRDSQKKKITPQ